MGCGGSKQCADTRSETLAHEAITSTSLPSKTEASLEATQQDVQVDESPQQQDSLAEDLLKLHGGILEKLAALGKHQHPGSDTVAAVAPEEDDRVPMRNRGVSLRFLMTIAEELRHLKRFDYDAGQFLNGGHTTDSMTDWREFSRARDPLCGKSCCLHTGTSFVETCIAAGITHDVFEQPFFGTMNTFVSYTWRGEGITLVNLIEAVRATLEEDNEAFDPSDCYMFVDVLVCAQHRGTRPKSMTCPNATDVAKFKEVIVNCQRLLLCCAPIGKPKVLSRVWCLFEIMSAIESGCQVLVALSAVDQRALADLLEDDFDNILKLFSGINSESAEATIKSDYDMVRNWILKALGPQGFAKLDETVADGLRTWLAGAALRLGNAKVDDNERKGRLIKDCAKLLLHLGKLDEAEMQFRNALKIFEKLYGETDLKVTGPWNGIASVLSNRGQHEEAASIQKKCVQIHFEHNDSSSKEAADLIHNLAGELDHLEDYEAAEENYRQAWKIYDENFGPKSSESAATINDLASTLESMKRYDEAEALFVLALEIGETKNGPVGT